MSYIVFVALLLPYAFSQELSEHVWYNSSGVASDSFEFLQISLSSQPVADICSSALLTMWQDEDLVPIEFYVTDIYYLFIYTYNALPGPYNFLYVGTTIVAPYYSLTAIRCGQLSDVDTAKNNSVQWVSLLLSWEYDCSLLNIDILHVAETYTYWNTPYPTYFCAEYLTTTAHGGATFVMFPASELTQVYYTGVFGTLPSEIVVGYAVSGPDQLTTQARAESLAYDFIEEGIIFPRKTWIDANHGLGSTIQLYFPISNIAANAPSLTNENYTIALSAYHTAAIDGENYVILYYTYDILGRGKYMFYAAAWLVDSSNFQLQLDRVSLPGVDESAVKSNALNYVSMERSWYFNCGGLDDATLYDLTILAIELSNILDVACVEYQITSEDITLVIFVALTQNPVIYVATARDVASNVVGQTAPTREQARSIAYDIVETNNFLFNPTSWAGGNQGIGPFIQVELPSSLVKAACPSSLIGISQNSKVALGAYLQVSVRNSLYLLLYYNATDAATGTTQLFYAAAQVVSEYQFYIVRCGRPGSQAKSVKNEARTYAALANSWKYPCTEGNLGYYYTVATELVPAGSNCLEFQIIPNGVLAGAVTVFKIYDSDSFGYVGVGWNQTAFIQTYVETTTQEEAEGLAMNCLQYNWC